MDNLLIVSQLAGGIFQTAKLEITDRYLPEYLDNIFKSEAVEKIYPQNCKKIIEKIPGYENFIFVSYLQVIGPAAEGRKEHVLTVLGNINKRYPFIKYFVKMS